MPPESEEPHAVVCHLDDLLAAREMTLTELADRVGVTVVNLGAEEQPRAGDPVLDADTAVRGARVSAG